MWAFTRYKYILVFSSMTKVGKRRNYEGHLIAYVDGQQVTG